MPAIHEMYEANHEYKSPRDHNQLEKFLTLLKLFMLDFFSSLAIFRASMNFRKIHTGYGEHGLTNYKENHIGLNKTESLVPNDIYDCASLSPIPNNAGVNCKDNATGKTLESTEMISTSTENLNLSNPNYALSELKNLRVLVIDDALSNRKLLSILLRKRGCEVKMVEDGVEALKALKKAGNLSYFDLVFMDNIMPNMTGTKCVKNMRRMGFTNIIIGLTGNTLEEELIEFCVAGTDLVLTKPLCVGILDSIWEYLPRSGGFKSRLNEKMKLKVCRRSTTIGWSYDAYSKENGTYGSSMDRLKHDPNSSLLKVGLTFKG